MAQERAGSPGAFELVDLLFECAQACLAAADLDLCADSAAPAPRWQAQVRDTAALCVAAALRFPVDAMRTPILKECAAACRACVQAYRASSGMPAEFARCATLCATLAALLSRAIRPAVAVAGAFR